jgi:hypothetical protein
MKLYGIDLPDIRKENAVEILKICRDIHLREVRRRIKNINMQKWDKYWVDAYNMILEILNIQ